MVAVFVCEVRGNCLKVVPGVEYELQHSPRSSTMDCLFCKIIEGEIPSTFIFQDAKLVAFKDIHPKAKIHILVVPRQHTKSLEELTAEDQSLMGHVMLKLPEIAKSQGLQDGFRTVINTGPGGGQEIDHLHVHILGGGRLPGLFGG